MTNDGMKTSTGGDAQTLTDEAGALKDKAAGRLAQEADSRKGQVADGMKQVSSALDSAASELGGDETPAWLKQGVTKLASAVNSLASELESTDSRELTRKVREFARRSPGTFLGACAAAGFAASRVFTAGQSSSSDSGSSTRQSFGGGSMGTTPSASTLGQPYGQDRSYGSAAAGGMTTPAATGDTLGSTS